MIRATIWVWIGCGLVLSQAVAAADYPARPIRMIVANAPGSTSDIFGRLAFSRMSDILDQQIVVDNRPGAGGVIGAQVAAQAPADGYTLAAFTAAVLTIVPHVQAKVTYHPFKTFAPVSLFVRTQTALCVTPALPVQSIREFVALGNSGKVQLNLASAGVGSTSHLGGLMFATMARMQASHVPYKGGGPAMAAIAQGESQWILGPLGTAMSHVRAGRIRCLATGGETRSIAAPQLPTIAESGVPGFRYYGWNGVLAPAQVAPAIIAKLNATMKQALQTEAVRKLFLAQGEEPSYTTTAEFAALIKADYAAMGQMVKRAGIGAK